MPDKILIINIFGIGDVLFTTPLISNIKKKFPSSSIGYVCNKRTESVVRNNNKIDKIFIYERDYFNSVYEKSVFQCLKELMAFMAEIKKERYDTVFDFSLNRYFSFLSWSIGIKNRIGLNYKRRSIFLTKKILLEGFEGKHVVSFYLELLKEIGIEPSLCGMELNIKDTDTVWADKFLKNNNIKAGGLLIGIVPGGGSSWGKEAKFKRWDTKKYAKLADKLIEKFQADIILMGGKDEETLCLEVANCMKSRPPFLGTNTTIEQFSALAKKCALVITNDGGPLHIAVASGVKTASIFGPVDETVYGPYPAAGNIVITDNIACRPCYRNFRKASCEHMGCLNNIEVDDVVSALEKVLN